MRQKQLPKLLNMTEETVEMAINIKILYKYSIPPVKSHKNHNYCIMLHYIGLNKPVERLLDSIRGMIPNNVDFCCSFYTTHSNAYKIT